MPSKALVIALALIGTAACTTGNAPPPSLTQADTAVGCPLGVRGATVTAGDTFDGIELTFTSPDRTAEMRQRVNDAAAQHGPGERMGQGHNGQHGHGADHGLQIMQLPASRTVSEEVENGAKIRFVPVEKGDLVLLRTKVRERAASMAAASCK